LRLKERAREPTIAEGPLTAVETTGEGKIEHEIQGGLARAPACGGDLGRRLRQQEDSIERGSLGHHDHHRDSDHSGSDDHLERKRCRSR
jgi:hypothetical protein